MQQFFLIKQTIFLSLAVTFRVQDAYYDMILKKLEICKSFYVSIPSNRCHRLNLFKQTSSVNES